MTDTGHHFCDFGAVRLVWRQVQQQRDGADQPLAVEGAENDTLVSIG
jgi:hypothetical protein